MSSLLLSSAATLLPPQHLRLRLATHSSPRKPPTLLLLTLKDSSSDLYPTLASSSVHDQQLRRGEVDRAPMEAVTHDASRLCRRQLLVATTSMAGLLIFSPSQPPSAQATPSDLSLNLPHKYSSQEDFYSTGRDPLDSVNKPPLADHKQLELGVHDAAQPSSAFTKRTEIIAGLGSASVDTTLSSLVVRPSNRAEFAKKNNLELEDVEEVLELKDVKLLGSSAVSLAVFLNLPTADSKTPHNIAEYMGSFSMLRPLIGPSLTSSKVNARFGISDNIRRLGLRDQSKIAVTLVAQGDSRSAKGSITVGGLRIVYE